MKLEVVRDYDAMSQRGAELVSALIQRKPDSVIGLAAGRTPTGMYSRLVEMHEKGALDFSRVTTFNLDEFVRGESSIPVYEALIWEEFLGRTNIDPGNVHFPGNGAASLEHACAEYEALIERAGGIDLQVLGVGTNGHLAFNEPGSSRWSLTRRVLLTAESMRANAHHFDSDEQVPREAITMGIATILRAGSLLVLASGESKAPAVRSMLEGTVTQDVPASYIKNHTDSHVILDEAAASLLSAGAESDLRPCADTGTTGP